MSILFEYHNTERVDNASILKEYLHRVWQEGYSYFNDEEKFETNDEIDKKNYQPFLQFDGNYITARNYVGFIQTENLHLEIYPKVFKNQSATPVLMLRHLFYWFDYCRKKWFPFTKSNLDTFDNIEFPELIIYLMASKMLETVSSLPISLYQPIEESLHTPKGKINFNSYLSNGFISGNQHIIDCNYEPFVFDNRLNRAIKYTSRLLLNKTKFEENQNILQELIFILDDVEDQICSYHDLETVVLNPLFEEYAEIKDICKIVLQQLLYANQQYYLSQWCLLFPMEYIFEDFIAGFLETKFSSKWKVEYQKSNMNLSSDPEAFQMQHDIFLTSKKDKTKKVIVDTKYKLRDLSFKGDKKKGVAQADMYQMTSYAFRRGCSNVLVLYPNIHESINTKDSFKIQSGFVNNEQINITTAEVPFWSVENFSDSYLSNEIYQTLSELLEVYE